MKCREIYREENEAVLERFELSMERIHEICTEEMQEKNFEEYFQKVAAVYCIHQFSCHDGISPYCRRTNCDSSDRQMD